MKNIYVFKSTREGVEKPVERKITNVIKGVSFRGKEKVPVDRLGKYGLSLHPEKTKLVEVNNGKGKW